MAQACISMTVRQMVTPVVEVMAWAQGFRPLLRAHAGEEVTAFAIHVDLDVYPPRGVGNVKPFVLPNGPCPQWVADTSRNTLFLLRWVLRRGVAVEVSRLDRRDKRKRRETIELIVQLAHERRRRLIDIHIDIGVDDVVVHGATAVVAECTADIVLCPVALVIGA